MHPDELLPLDTKSIALLLDIDGTLLDLAATPREVWVPPELQTSLKILFKQLDGAIAFVSGRSISDIDLIFSPLLLPAVGGHGAEFRLEINDKSSGPPPIGSQLKHELATIRQIGPGIIVEDKGYAVALHYRLAPDKGPMVAAAVASICARFPDEPIDVLHGKSVIEIKPAGHNKATGIRALMQHAPFAGRRPVFIGDDVTDEIVFPMVPQFNGFGFSVGRDVVGTNGCFQDPDQVRHWLYKMAGVGAPAAESKSHARI